jgi:hypothetical protein
MENYTHLILKQLQNKQGGLLMGGAQVKVKSKGETKKSKKVGCGIKTGSDRVYIPHEFDTRKGSKGGTCSRSGGVSIKDIVNGAKQALGYAKHVCSLIHGSGILTGGSGWMEQLRLENSNKEDLRPSCFVAGPGCKGWKGGVGSGGDIKTGKRKLKLKMKKGGVESGGDLTGGIKGDNGAQWSQFLRDYSKSNPKPKDMKLGQFSELAGREFRIQNPPKEKKKLSSWNHFLGSYLLEHPDEEFSVAVKKASRKYKKKGGELSGGVESGGSSRPKGGELSGGIPSGGELSGGVESGGSSRPKGGELSGGRKISPWNVFLSSFRKKHPEMKFGEVAKQASIEYKKTKAKV